MIGYFTVNFTQNDENYIDWKWLNSNIPVEEKIFVKHFSFDNNLTIKMNSQKKLGVILKPGAKIHE